MTDVTELRNVVFEYLSKKIDRKEFTGRFLALSYNLAHSGSDSAVEFSHAIHSHLAPAIHGITSEDQLRDALGNCFTKSIFSTIYIEPTNRIKDDAVWRRSESSSAVTAIASFQGTPA
jgi:hypothetical protein